MPLRLVYSSKKSAYVENTTITHTTQCPTASKNYRKANISRLCPEHIQYCRRHQCSTVLVKI